MARIKILPENLSNKIAAGEVVERPSSVVKELVENSIDAGSDRILVEVEKGGRSLIQVADNGAGMSRDDALLSVERYATSKIADENDLFSIRTLGFRGEALPSIASVSRFSLVTREAGADSGTQIVIEGGTIRKVTETGSPPGTLISVRHLFFNTPARRKFLKTVNTEFGHIVEAISAMALANPGVRFRLVHDGRTVKDWPASTDPAVRVADVLGTGLRLLPAFAENGQAAVSGWIGAPDSGRSTSRGISLFVNSRPVKDRLLQHALLSGFSGRLMKGQFPVAVLFVKVPFDRVDVNVHPTKNEIRFAEAAAVHDTVVEAVRNALQEGDRPEWGAPGTRTDGPPVVRDPVQGFGKEAKFQVSGFKFQEKMGRRGIAQSSRLKAESQEWKFFEGRSSDEKGQPLSEHREQEDRASEKSIGPEQQRIWEKGKFADLRVVGQASGTYIVCEAEGKIVMVDQHAAHERILYERLRSQAKGARSQRLLLPETLEVGVRESEVLEALVPALSDLGLEIEPFGGQTFVVRAVPALVQDRQLGPVLLEIAEKAVEAGALSDPDGIIDEARKILACHGAIRAHQTLSAREMADLMAELDLCSDPAHCPHGRPTWIEWTLQEIEKRFRRIV